MGGPGAGVPIPGGPGAEVPPAGGLLQRSLLLSRGVLVRCLAVVIGVFKDTPGHWLERCLDSPRQSLNRTWVGCLADMMNGEGWVEGRVSTNTNSS